MAATVRAALYLRVSTGRQADSDLSIPDQRRQAKAYCASRGWEIVSSDPLLKERVTELKSVRDQARADAERAEGALDRAGPRSPQALKTFASQARRRMRTESGGYRRDHLRALAQRIEVDAKEVRIMGAKTVLLRTLVAASNAKTAGFGVPSSVPKWRTRHDSNV
ncbi:MULTISPECIES: recombinase family protein [unclassified Bradyrhizobium]|uniref:recombinase family protein n=1 Tax=unclassified Bradyrhizobium TaxID=2631580 RepID=UPI0028E981B5|nr:MULTISPECIES: recombinase family protein [unclassified Bradyrhizobium]